MEKHWPKGNNAVKVRTVLIVLAILGFAYYVWPGRYIYRNVSGGRIIRIDRLTGQARQVRY